MHLQQLLPSYYTAGVIVESISEPAILEPMHNWLVHERTTNMPLEEEQLWHVREYHIPAEQLESTMQMLEGAIKKGWYIHIFNMTDEVLIVVLHGKIFKLPLQKNEDWELMIAYGITVGVERKWTEHIPVGRV